MLEKLGVTNMLDCKIVVSFYLVVLLHLVCMCDLNVTAYIVFLISFECCIFILLL